MREKPWMCGKRWWLRDVKPGDDKHYWRVADAEISGRGYVAGRYFLTKREAGEFLLANTSGYLFRSKRRI